MSDINLCPHTRTVLIAKDADAEYIECLDCGAIVETGELAEPKSAPNNSFDQSLADA